MAVESHSGNVASADGNHTEAKPQAQKPRIPFELAARKEQADHMRAGTIDKPYSVVVGPCGSMDESIQMAAC